MITFNHVIVINNMPKITNGSYIKGINKNDIPEALYMIYSYMGI